MPVVIVALDAKLLGNFIPSTALLDMQAMVGGLLLVFRWQQGQAA